ncbi:hypothetical protein C8J56DRAFT_1041838 [Mycena floridula]|nr:hypothetical protein C8J56DRAFT_1041838 [Mycena floridula]
MPQKAEVQGVEVLPSCLDQAADFFHGLRSPVYVRDDYKTAWNHILEALEGPEPSDGFIVWSQPGMGNTLFYRFMLAKALENRIPVACCENNLFFRYFDKHGTRRMTYAEAETFDFPERVLALFDTRCELESPLPPFANGVVDALVVQTRAIMLYEPQKWEVGRRILNWMIRVWTDQEIIIQQGLLPRPSEAHYSATEISQYLGPNPKLCSRLINKTDNPIADFENFLLPVDQESFSALLVELSNDPIHWYEALNFHAYFYAYRHQSFTRPLLSPVHPSTMFSYHFPTAFVRDAISRQLHKPDPAVDLALSRAKLPPP